jgi:hypothetical protein
VGTDGLSPFAVLTGNEAEDDAAGSAQEVANAPAP